MERPMLCGVASTSKMSSMYQQESKQSVKECVWCHLCANEVPKRFIKEHYQSFKHEINAKIAVVALERVQKSLHCNIISDVDETVPLHFCPQCLISMNPQDRRSHEKTTVHKKALLVDKFLCDFYVLYANDDGNSSDAGEDEPNNEIPNISVNVDNNLSTNISENIQATTSNCVGENNGNETKSDSSNNAKIVKSDVIENEKTTKHDPHTIAKNNYHIFCETCKVYVPNNKSNVISHQNGFRHKQLLPNIKKQ